MQIKKYIEMVAQNVLGKKEFRLSEDIPFSYLFFAGLTHFTGLVRGYFRRLGFSKCGKNLFLSSNVRLRTKNKMKFGNNVRIQHGSHIEALSKEGIVFGNNVKIGENNRILCTGSLAELGKGIVIGDNSFFSENTFFGAAGGIKIGSDVIAGQNVRFHSENHNFDDLDKLIRNQGVNRKGITLGNNIWIGSGAVFLDGAKLGNGCIVAANAVVTKQFPDNVIVGGIPARIIKNR